MGLTIGVDIGGTKIAAGVVDDEGTILETSTVPTPPTPEGVVDAIADAVRTVSAGYQVEAVGMPQEAVDGFKQTPFWTELLPLAHTLAYDGHCLGGDEHPVPAELLARLDVPVLALASTGSPAFLREPARRVAAAAGRGPRSRTRRSRGNAPRCARRSAAS